MASGVKELVAKLNAERTKSEQEARAKYEQELAAYEAAVAAKLAEEQAAAAAAAAEKQRQREAEAARWKVDEQAAADEVARLKKEFIARNKPKKPVQQAEVTPIVIDVGSCTIKAGFGGHDAPLHVFSAVVGRVQNTHIMDLEKHKHVERDVYVGDECWIFKDVLRIRRVVKNGVVQDWDDFKLLLEHLFYTEMGLTPAALAEHPVMFVEPPLNPRANRDRLLRTLLEHFPVPAVFVANTATLGLYATGTVSGVLVEVGHDVALSVAIYDGVVLPATMRRLDVAGQALDLYLIRLLNERGYRFNELNALDGFVVRDLKESVCRVAPSHSAVAAAAGADTDYDTRSHGNALLPGFDRKTFPDVLRVGIERTRVPEALFDPVSTLGRDFVVNGLDNMVHETFKAVPMDLARIMYSNVVLAGGTTLLPGLAERLTSELKTRLPPTAGVVVQEPLNRHLSAWVGASVLSTSEKFNFYWLSREEFEATGTANVHAPP